MGIWLLLVHHDFHALGGRFLVDVDMASDLVDHMKEKVKVKRPEALSRAHADPADLTVWKTKGPLIINKTTSKGKVAEILGSIKVNDKNTIEELREDELLADLGLSDGRTLLVRLPSTSHSPCESSEMGMARALGESCRHEVTINMLPDGVFLEIFALCVHTYGDMMRECRKLTHVCQRWRQIIYASPHYLELLLFYSSSNNEEMPVKNLSYWPAFPIAMSYRLPDDEDDVISLLKHSDRIQFIDLNISKAEGKVVAAMQKPFPMLTNLELLGRADLPAFPNGFLGGSVPCLKRVDLYHIPFPALPTLLLSARDLVSLRLGHIPPTCYISPEAMVASLAVLSKLETLYLSLTPTPGQRRRRLDPPMRAVLPALTDFDFGGPIEYLEDFVARIDAPRLLRVETVLLPPFDTCKVPQLSLFISRTENLRFRRVQVEISSAVDIKLDPLPLDYPSGSQFSLYYAYSNWSGTHAAYLAHVLPQIFAMCSKVDYLSIQSSHFPYQYGDIRNTEWLAFFHLLSDVETLRASGSLAEQVARALEDVPGEMVTDVLPSLHSLILDVPNTSTKKFVSLRQLHGCPVTIRDDRRFDLH